jgi:hypothetical protein
MVLAHPTPALFHLGNAPGLPFSLTSFIDPRFKFAARIQNTSSQPESKIVEAAENRRKARLFCHFLNNESPSPPAG